MFGISEGQSMRFVISGCLSMRFLRLFELVSAALLLFPAPKQAKIIQETSLIYCQMSIVRLAVLTCVKPKRTMRQADTSVPLVAWQRSH